MKKLIIFILMYGLISISYGQFTFNGFQQPQCGMLENSPYTYNWKDCSPGYGYEIYKNGVLKYQMCPGDPMESSKLKKFLTLTNSKVITVVTSLFDDSKILKSVNSCTSFSTICYSFEGKYEGYFQLTPHTGFLITTVSLESYKRLGIRRVTSENQLPPVFDTVLSGNKTYYFPIDGEPFCEMDSLSFNIYTDTSTLHYSIIWDSLEYASKEVTADNRLKIYPNPSSKYFAISNPKIKNIGSIINIYDIQGIRIRNFQGDNKNRYFIQDLPIGIYIVEIITDNTKVYTKLVKR